MTIGRPRARVGYTRVGGGDSTHLLPRPYNGTSRLSGSRAALLKAGYEHPLSASPNKAATIPASST